MTDRIYLIDGNGVLRPMPETQFDSEEAFQELLGRYPGLLCGDDASDEDPRRWILVKREMEVADHEGGDGRWSLDHLFLDQDGIPTLVEVKRCSDTRLRREVVGQILDYAANAVVYWPIESIRAEFESRVSGEAGDPDEVVMTCIREAEGGPEDRSAAVEAFWQRVKTNLEAQKIRLVIVADSIPPELERIVEFLNGQMDPAECIALQLKPYAAGDFRTLVPRVLGRTSKSERRKGPRKPPKQWDQTSLLEAIQGASGPEAARIAEDLIAWSADVAEPTYGKGATVGYFYQAPRCPELESLFQINTKGNFLFSLWGLRDRAELAEPLEQVREELNALPGIDLPPIQEFWHREIPLTALADPDVRQRFKVAIEGFLKAVSDRLGT
ncbi:MAG: hypothetical protein WBF17_18535 [Phycisphaerae bacterium]